MLLDCSSPEVHREGFKDHAEMLLVEEIPRDERSGERKKLDGVGPVDNRPSTRP